MVSIITCTKRSSFIDNVFENYERQTFDKKELIIVLNTDNVELNKWEKRGENDPSVSIYLKPSAVTLGECFNYAVNKAKFHYIAKFDDDDYYAPKYLEEMMQSFTTTKADIVGKRSIYAYIQDEHALFIRDGGHENKYTRHVRDCTLVVKKALLKKLRIAHENQGAFWTFQNRCRKKGYKIYSTSKNNFTYMRRDQAHHTMKWSMERFKKDCQFVKFTKDYQAEVIS